MKDVHSTLIHEFTDPAISLDSCHGQLVQAKLGSPNSDLNDNLVIVCDDGISGTSHTSCVTDDGRGHVGGSAGSGGHESVDTGLERNDEELHGPHQDVDLCVANGSVAIGYSLESSYSGDDQVEGKTSVDPAKVASDCDENGKCGRIIIRDSVETNSTSENAAVRFVCSVDGCGRSYSRRQGLKRHTNAAHSDKKSNSSNSFSSNSEQNSCKDATPGNDGSAIDQLSPVSESKKINKFDLQPGDDIPKENPTTTNTWKCTKVECGRVFTNRQNLKRHLRGHQRYQYKCPQCPMEFIKHRQLKIHEYSHTKAEPFSCSVCGKKFVLPSRLRAHEKIHQGYRCQIDGCTREPFSKWSEMRKHVAAAHPKIHHCDECSHAFATIPAMKRHFAKRHLSATYTPCRHPGCGVKLTPGTEKLHHRNHHGENGVPKDTVEANLEKEISFSEQPTTDMSRFGNSGANSNNSSVDMEDKHKSGEILTDIVGVKSPLATCSDDSLKLFYCDKCSKCFAKERYLRWHIRRIHDRCERINPDGSVAKPYVCDHEGCGKSFARPYQLSQHKNAHLNVKPYRCEEPGCSRSYSGRQSLKKHLLDVHGVRLEAREALEDALGSLGAVDVDLEK